LGIYENDGGNVMSINEELVRRLIDVVKPGLSHGLGEAKPGMMCVEAAVCYAYGLPHGDNPPCVNSVVRAYKIRLNDSGWSSNKARAKGMLPLAIAQLGSDTLDGVEFGRKIIVRTTQTIIADLFAEHELSVELSECEDLMRIREICLKFKNDAYANAAAYAAANDAANDAAYAAANAADAYNAYAANAADAANAAAYAAYAAYATRAKSDAILIQASNNALAILQEMNSPGCAYLYLLEAS
jgi:hypothetical protein